WSQSQGVGPALELPPAQLLAGGSIPDDNLPPLVTADQELAVRTEAQAPDPIPMAFPNLSRLLKVHRSLEGVGHLTAFAQDRFFPRSRIEPDSIAARGRGLHVPVTDRVVVTGRDQPAAVRGGQQASDGIGMSVQAAHGRRGS